MKNYNLTIKLGPVQSDKTHIVSVLNEAGDVLLAYDCSCLYDAYGYDCPDNLRPIKEVIYGVGESLCMQELAEAKLALTLC